LIASTSSLVEIDIIFIRDINSIESDLDNIYYSLSSMLYYTYQKKYYLDLILPKVMIISND